MRNKNREGDPILKSCASEMVIPQGRRAAFQYELARISEAINRRT